MEETKRSSVIPIAPENPRLSETNSQLLEYWLIIRPWKRRIIAATAAAVALTLVLTGFVMSPWYQAEAVIRPASQEGPNSPTANWIGSSAGGTLAALGMAAGLGQSIPSDASEFMLVLNSYDFTTNLIQRHRLEPIVDRVGHFGQIMAFINRLFGTTAVGGAKASQAGDETKWRRFKTMQQRFQQDYDDKLGNLTLTVVDRNRETARAILNDYVEDLRAVIRNRALHDTTTAVASLEEELDKTSDPMIRTQIARLIAQQIQQEKMAQAQADFAFTVVEPPYTRAHAVKPQVVLDCVLVALLVPLMFVVSLVFYHRVYLPIHLAQENMGTRNEGGRSEQERMPFAASKR